MKRAFYLLLIGILSMAVISGCQKDGSSTDLQDDEGVVQSLALDEDDEYLFDLGIDDGSEDNILASPLSNEYLSKISVPIDSLLRFGRVITDRGLRRLDIRRIAPDTFKVFIARELAGRFVIFDKTSENGVTRYVKRLRHVVRRSAIFVRRISDDASGNDSRRNWKLDQITLGSGNSVPTSTIDIHEVTVTTSNGDSVTYTNPAENYLKVPDDILTLTPGTEVTVTVKLQNLTSNPIDPNGNGSTETVLLHYGARRGHHERRFFDFVGVDPVSGDNIYQGAWIVGQEPFHIYHAIVDAIDNGTIYDSDPAVYPYNSTNWGVYYLVVDAD